MVGDIRIDGGGRNRKVNLLDVPGVRRSCVLLVDDVWTLLDYIEGEGLTIDGFGGIDFAVLGEVMDFLSGERIGAGEDGLLSRLDELRSGLRCLHGSAGDVSLNVALYLSLTNSVTALSCAFRSALQLEMIHSLLERVKVGGVQ